MNRQCYIQTSKRSNIDIIQITGRLEAENESKLANDISEKTFDEAMQLCNTN